MTQGERGLLEIPLRDQWHRLPTPDAHASLDLVKLLESFDLNQADTIVRLERGLRAVSTVAASLPQGSRESRALVRNPSTGHVDALLSVRIRPVPADGYDQYLAAAQKLHATEQTELIHRQIEEIRLPLGCAVVSHDYTYPVLREGIPDPVMERTFLALFPDSDSVCLEFTLLTQDLALFADAPVFLVALAAGDNPPIPGMDQE